MKRSSTIDAALLCYTVGALTLAQDKAGPALQPSLVKVLAGHVKDYTYMWWTNGLRDERQSFSVQTSHYPLQFDVLAFQLTHLIPLKTPPSEADALTQGNDAILGAANASLRCVKQTGDGAYAAESASKDFKDSHLIEDGKFFERRTITKIVWAKGAPQNESSLEAMAWA